MARLPTAMFPEALAGAMPSVIGVQVQVDPGERSALEVFQTPPPAVPREMIRGSVGWVTMVRSRPESSHGAAAASKGPRFLHLTVPAAALAPAPPGARRICSRS